MGRDGDGGEEEEWVGMEKEWVGMETVGRRRNG